MRLNGAQKITANHVFDSTSDLHTHGNLDISGIYNNVDIEEFQTLAVPLNEESTVQGYLDVRIIYFYLPSKY